MEIYIFSPYNLIKIATGYSVFMHDYVLILTPFQCKHIKVLWKFPDPNKNTFNPIFFNSNNIHNQIKAA